MLAHFYVKDNDKPGNVELMQYLNAEKHRLWQSGVKFKFEFVERDEPYIKQGITKLPCLSINDKKYLGMEGIRRCLDYIKSGKKHQEEEDPYKNLMENEMTFDKAINEKDEEPEDDIKKKFDMETRRRQQTIDKPTQKKEPIQNKKPKKSKSQSSPMEKDDDLMASKLGIDDE